MKWLRNLIVFSLCMPACGGASAGACDLRPLSVTGSRASSGLVSVNLGEADDLVRPSAWQGPLLIGVVGKPVCTVSDVVALIERPLLLGNGRFLFVPTYSGSTNRVYELDVRDCRVVWKSLAFRGHMSHAGNGLSMGSRTLTLSPSCRM